MVLQEQRLEKVSSEGEALPSGKWENENLSQIPFKVFRGTRCDVTSCQFCNDDRNILSSSKDGKVHLWSTATGRIIQTFQNHTLPVTKARITLDGKRIISSSFDRTVCVSDTETGALLWQQPHDGIVTCTDVSNDSNLVVSCTDFDHGLHVWNLETGEMVNSIKFHHGSTPTCCALSPNGQRIATTSMDKETKIYDIISQKNTVTLGGHKNIVSSCSFSSNERYLCTTSWDKSLQVWDISTGMFRSKGSTLLTKGHDGSVSCCQFSNEADCLVSGGYDKSVVLWDLTCNSTKLVLKGHDDWVTGVDISKNSKLILSSSQDHTIRLWNIEGADRIPQVIENRRALGLKITQCEKCSKPFSISQTEDDEDFNVCVFCRLADPNRNTLPAFTN